MNLQQKNKHLMARAGFGISLEQYREPRSVHQAVHELFPAAPAQPLTITSDEEWTQMNELKTARKDMDSTARQQTATAFRQETKGLIQLWFDEMVQTPYPLREKMSLFWHGHFATRVANPYFDQLLLQELRSNALGNFGNLLKAVSKSPAMLQFLNNQQNTKQHPNENFAREVMELFTLGRGHYTEADVKEAARAFTGWGFDKDAQFVARGGRHDDGEKTFLGKNGAFNGDDILNMLLDQRQTALFITTKIYRFFVADEHDDAERVASLADYFYKQQYDIAALLQKIFTADWFYSDAVTGAIIKSPIDLLAGYQRTIPVTFKNENTALVLQRSLGQALFYPPNVAGWPGGRNWIDSSSLVLRMRLPEALYGDKSIDLSPKEIEGEMGEGGKRPMMQQAPEKGNRYHIIASEVDWEPFLASWRSVAKEQLPELLAGYLVAGPLHSAKLNSIIPYSDHDSMDDYIKSLTILLMELPEYQLC